MANLVAAPARTAVPQIETTTALLGGPGGPLNLQAQALLNQIEYDRQQGALGVTYQQAGTGATVRSVRDRLRETVSVRDFGAVGDGATNDAPAIQACIDYVNTLPAINRPEVFIPAGRYLIQTGITLYDNITVRGVPRDIGYWYAFGHSSELIAGVAMPFMVDITGSNIYLGHLGLYGNGIANYGLYTNIPVGQPRKSSSTFEFLAITLCLKTGVHLFNLGLTKMSNVQISDCKECGLDIANSGDSDFNNLYINTINQDIASTVNGPSSATVLGVGIRLRDSSGNINIRGGKIEFTRIGILLNGVDGVNISGINFDTNRKACIYIDSDSITAFPAVTTENAGTVTSVQITGNRFLGGSVGNQGISSHVFAANCRYVTISGNGFKRAGDAARDFATDTAQGPNYGIHLFNAELCTVTGNDLYAAGTQKCLFVEHATPANAQHTINANSLDGTETVTLGTVRAQPNFGNLTFASGFNPVAQSTAKAWVKFNGLTNVIISAYNVASVTGSAGTYDVNFTAPMANADYATVVSVRNWNNPTDNGLAGAATTGKVIVYSTSNGALAANGEITVTVFG